jgi:predicted GH43/DUF377 family glycosyl hydrolase
VDIPSLLKRQPVLLRPDPKRVIVRPFRPSVEPRNLMPTDKSRANHIVDRVMAMKRGKCSELLTDILENFQGRHRNLLPSFLSRADEMEDALRSHQDFTSTQKQIIGSYFLNEYAYEAAALFNPSIIAHPDQSTAPERGLRFILSLRAVGEGHVSSLTFRSGTIAEDGRVILDPTSKLATLAEVGARLNIDQGEQVNLQFSPDTDLSERVIFPVTLAQSNGIEDARFVRFIDGGQTTYYATYTAYSGRAIRSELITTDDFISFQMRPLGGDAALNKGMALFPKRIDGKYAMIARQDNENLYLIYSDDLYQWNGGVEILRPRYPWEFVQIGNCGSPIELDEGWLMLTHGVGPVRRYCIGAVLLSKGDPSKVLARSEHPLIYPMGNEREGYVPNVVYTCGALRHGDHLILPYAISDTFTTFGSINIEALLSSLVKI